MMKTHELFDIGAVTAALRGLLEVELPYEVLARLEAFMAEVKDERCGEVHPAAVLEGQIYLAPGARIGPHAYVKGPAWIGEGAEVGQGAYLRGDVALAPGAKVGHASEVKRSLLLEGAKAPHFNYVGDAVIGRGVNLGAGVKLANFSAFGSGVKVEGRDIGLRKFSAALGDGVSIGCNAVLSPGTIVGPRTVVYSGAVLGGVYPADTVIKLRQVLEQTQKRLKIED
jgi:bifunctional UDP-N-acetylglucosamine pyrophosphorylase/glucosamine-1-phosphate N-acetyltransferase